MNIIRINQFHLSLILLILIAVVVIVTFIIYPPIYGTENSPPSFTVTEGIASGDVTNDSAIIWSRVNKLSNMHVEFANNTSFINSKSETKLVDQNTDFTGNIKLNNLRS